MTPSKLTGTINVNVLLTTIGSTSVTVAQDFISYYVEVLFTLECAFPDHKDAPSILTEQVIVLRVSDSSLRQFRPPVIHVALWRFAPRTRVTVPKAISYLDYRLVFTQGHIGPSRQVISVKAVAKPPSMNSPSNSEFRTGSSICMRSKASRMV